MSAPAEGTPHSPDRFWPGHDEAPLGVWWARQDLNLQPTDYESAALTRLSYGPARGIQINPADEPSPDPSPKSAKAFSTRRHAPHLS